jgi:hypothetical protein
MMTMLTTWLDESFNGSHIYNRTLGFGAYSSFGAGALCGFITGLLFVITDKESKAVISATLGTLGLLCLVVVAKASGHDGRRAYIDGLISGGPTALWLLLMLLYGIWLWSCEHPRRKETVGRNKIA